MGDDTRQTTAAQPAADFNAKIGETAGKVWQFLNQNGPASVNRLAQTTGQNNRDVNRAIGWLAREGKVAFVRTDRGECVRLQ